MSWELIIETALRELAVFLSKGNWYGRENEVINLFAHHFLMKQVGVKPLIDASQIGIEVAVKQIPGYGKKKLVRKDLVLWQFPLQTVWKSRQAKNDPAAILEWKINQIKKCDSDIKWLVAYTNHFPKVIGFSICVFAEGTRDLRFRKIIKGKPI